MSQRRKAGDIVLKTATAGFVMRQGYAQIAPEALPEPFCVHQHVGPDAHHPNCCDDEECQEWSDLIMLPGNTLAQAQHHLQQGNHTGVAYHVSECEMADPPEALE